MNEFSEETVAFQRKLFTQLTLELINEEDVALKAEKLTALFSVLGWVVASVCHGDPELIDRTWMSSEAFILRSAASSAPMVRMIEQMGKLSD